MVESTRNVANAFCNAVITNEFWHNYGTKHDDDRSWFPCGENYYYSLTPSFIKKHPKNKVVELKKIQMKMYGLERVYKPFDANRYRDSSAVRVKAGDDLALGRIKHIYWDPSIDSASDLADNAIFFEIEFFTSIILQPQQSPFPSYFRLFNRNDSITAHAVPACELYWDPVMLFEAPNFTPKVNGFDVIIGCELIYRFS
jgi:hypothetical protein